MIGAGRNAKDWVVDKIEAKAKDKGCPAELAMTQELVYDDPNLVLGTLDGSVLQSHLKEIHDSFREDLT